MKYYMQKKSPSGNYYDANGTDNLDEAISFADWWRGQEEDKTAARVVERTEVVVDEMLRGRIT